MVDELELFAMRWLHWKRRCPIVLRERSPRSFICGRPDVIGVTRDRHMIEIEVKRSLSDLRNNSQKRFMDQREQRLPKFPRQFYFLVHHSIAQAAAVFVPEWAGLMRGPKPDEHHEVKIVTRAPPNREARKLTLKECVKLTFLLGNQLMAMEELRTRRARDLEGHSWWHRDYEI